MSENQPVPVPSSVQAGNDAPPAPKKRPSWLLPAVVAVLAGSIGYGAAGGAAAAPEANVVTETKEVEVIKEVEVPVETIVEVTPAACLEALDLAADGFDIAADMIGLIEPAARAGLEVNVDAISEITSSMAASNAQLEELTPRASAASTQCRAGS